LKEEALDRTMWRARFGPVIRQTTKRMNENWYMVDLKRNTTEPTNSLHQVYVR
jgi:hypothetical protein